MAKHVDALLRPLRRYPDPERSTDPQIRALVERLPELPIAPAPDPQFRSELRAQLVAVAPTLVEHARAEQLAAAKGAPGARHAMSKAPRTGFPVRRLLTTTASIVVVLALLLGGAVFFSRNALPGDALYGVKRASERVQIAFAGSKASTAQDYLEFAQKRAEETASLLGHNNAASEVGSRPSAAGVSAHTAELINTTLNSHDADLANAMRLLTNAASAQHSFKPLTPMVTWAPRQLTRLQDIAKDATADGTVQTRVNNSTARLVAAWNLTKRLNGKYLGPVNCTICDKPSSSTPTQGGTAPGGTSSGTSSPSSGGGGAPKSSSTKRGAGAGQPSVGASRSAGSTHAAGSSGAAANPPAAGNGSSSAATGGGVTVHASVPKVPGVSVTPSVGASVGCQVSLSAGPVQIQITVCPSP